MSARYSRETDLRRWERETLMPALVGFLEASDHHWTAALKFADITIHTDFDELTRKNNDEAVDAAIKTWAHVDLVASSQVRAEADRLRMAQIEASLAAARLKIAVRAGSSTQVHARQRWDQRREVLRKSREDFVGAARTSLGVR